MANSIDHPNRRKGDNSISSLSFHWLAIFKDGSYINQVVGEEEHEFKEVQDRFDDLRVFILHHVENHNKFIVDLERGIICGNGVISHYKIEEAEKKNIRLIHFRRHEREFTEAGVEIKHIITYFLGYQYLDKDGKNRQAILQIDDSNGSWILEEN